MSVSTDTQPVSETATGPAVHSTASNHTVDLESNTTIRLQLQPDGDANWTISTRFNLTTESEQEAFRELAREFEDGNTSGASLGIEAFERASSQVDAETDREMEILEEGRTTSNESEITNGWGELTLEFTWENFARTDGERLYIDDILETESGLWFPGLAEDQRLTIRSPDGYGIDDANTVPENGSLHWEGPTTFDNTTLQATFIGNGGTQTTPTPADGTGPINDGSSGMAAQALGAIGLLAAIVVLVVLTMRRDRVEAILVSDTESGTTEREETGDSEPVDTAAEEEPPDDEPPAEEDGDGGIDADLLSDEERVERLLDRNGGRMKQANIVKETDWSNAKVSQLLSAMEENGQIDKLRIGRENLISFPEEDVAEISDDDK